MGLIKNEFTIENKNLTISPAYAYLYDLRADMKGNVFATFAIQQDRLNARTKDPLATPQIAFKADKTIPLWEQAYAKAKEEIFNEWEDDIVEEDEDIEDNDTFNELEAEQNED